MTKKGRRASQRRNEQDEATKGARPRPSVSGTSESVDEITQPKSQGTQKRPQPSQYEATDMERTQEGGLLDLGNESSVRFVTQTQTGQMDADQEFRHAVLAADEDLPETAVGDEAHSGMNSFLNGELEVVSGEDADQKYELTTHPIHLGRANPACHINLADVAVSQTHLIFDYIETTGRWTVCVSEDAPDGALLNSVRLEETKNLSHGDVIRIGRSELRFFYRSGAPQRQEILPRTSDEEEPTMSGFKSLTGRFFGSAADQTLSSAEELQETKRGHKNPKPTLMVGALVALLCFVGGLVYWAQAGSSNTLLNKTQVTALLAEAKTNVAQKDLEQAATKIESLLPWVEEIPDLKSFQRILTSEQESQKHLLDAKLKYKNGKVDAMGAHLDMIPNSSVFADERDALRAKHQAAQAQLSIRTIEGLLSKRKFAKATAEINNHRALWGENEKVTVLMRSVQQQKGKASQDSERMRQARLLLRQGAHLAALKVFEGQDMSALERGLNKKLVRFKNELAMGREGLKSKSGAKALKAFQTAKDLYGRLARSGEQTPFTRALDQNLANAHFLLGASTYPSAPCKGAFHFRQAHVLSPDDLKVKRRLDGMRLEADRVYREAQAVSKMNPKGAHQRAAAALCLVPQGSTLYRSLKSL